MKKVKVGDISTQIRGVSYGKSDVTDEPKEGYIPVLRANNIVDGKVDLTDLVYVKKGKISDRQYLRQGDILIAASSGSLSVVGKAATVTQEYQAGFGAFCKVLRPNDTVNHSYFANYFQTIEYRTIISHLAAGANINNLRNEHLDNLEIPLPPLDEQRRIATILDQADRLRTLRRETLAKLDSLLQATFLDMFGDPVTNPMGWEVKKLGKIVVNHDSTRIPVKSSDRANMQGSYPYYGASGIIDYVDQYLFHGDYLLVAEDGANLLARVTPIAFIAKGKFWVNNHAHVVQPKEIVRLQFIEYIFALLDIKPYLTGSTQPKLTRKNLDNIQIPCPPLDKQNNFVDFYLKLEKIRQNHQQSLTQLDNLFHSLQQRGFRGELSARSVV